MKVLRDGEGPLDTTPEGRRNDQVATKHSRPAQGNPISPKVHPSSFGLTRRELRAEIRRLTSLDGGAWQLWEIRARFARPSEVDQGQVAA